MGAGSARADTTIYEPQCFDTLAGQAGGLGIANGTGSNARFNEPWGIAVAVNGTIYVADTLNHTIRKITPTGVVSLLAGSPGVNGFADGAGIGVAMFDRPTGVAVDAAGNVYVADYNNNRIRKIDTGGVVSTVAGKATFGVLDGTGPAAEFDNPFGVALNGAGTLLYVSDQNNQSIRVISLPGGVVTTHAGLSGTVGYVNGTNGNARFNAPRGIAVDGAGNVYVADAGNLVVRKIAVGGGVTTLAGDPVTAFQIGFNDGPGAGARFSNLQAASPFGGPCGVAVDGLGNVYVTDQGFVIAPFNGHTIRKITPGGSVTTLAGAVGVSGSANGIGIAARFNHPAGIAADSLGRLYVADAVNHLIRSQFCCKRPDVAVGTSLKDLRGGGRFSPAKQRIVQTSPMLRRVIAFATIGNPCEQFDVISVIASPGTKLFGVSYQSSGANATASLISGSFRTPEINKDMAPTLIKATVTPNRMALAKVKGGRTVSLRRSISLMIRARSTFDPSMSDACLIQVKTR
jgi:secreted PhoX family phosphatase